MLIELVSSIMCQCKYCDNACWSEECIDNCCRIRLVAHRRRSPVTLRMHWEQMWTTSRRHPQFHLTARLHSPLATGSEPLPACSLGPALFCDRFVSLLFIYMLEKFQW